MAIVESEGEVDGFRNINLSEETQRFYNRMKIVRHREYVI